LATNMLRGGANFAEIGEILRHQDPNATEIYAKVDFVSLRAIAQPWPGGAKDNDYQSHTSRIVGIVLYGSSHASTESKPKYNRKSQGYLSIASEVCQAKPQ
jgi:hypothetical protein